jgi:hypothetical protein
LAGKPTPLELRPCQIPAQNQKKKVVGTKVLGDAQIRQLSLEFVVVVHAPWNDVVRVSPG